MSDPNPTASADPGPDVPGDDGRGVALYAGEWRLALAVRDLRAIRQPLPVARVPGSRPWVVGAANGRGRLLPVVDLLAYLYERSPDRNPAAQWLELEDDDRLVAIQVDALSGLRRFHWEGSDLHGVEVPPRLAACVAGSARDDEGEWLRLSTAALCRQPDFRDLGFGRARASAPC